MDIGSYGRLSDHGIFENSSFHSEFLVGKTILPAKPLPGTNVPVPDVLVDVYKRQVHNRKIINLKRERMQIWY